jgi:hypothetical protein
MSEECKPEDQASGHPVVDVGADGTQMPPIPTPPPAAAPVVDVTADGEQAAPIQGSTQSLPETTQGTQEEEGGAS